MLQGIPLGLGDRFQHVRQVSLAHVFHRQVFWRQWDAILVVALDGPQRQIFVDVLRVGNGCRGDGVSVRLLRVRVAFVTAEELVTFEHVFLGRLGFRRPEVPKIVCRRVGVVGCQGIRAQRAFQTGQPIAEKLTFRRRIQPVQPHVLQRVVVGAVVEGIDHVERGGVGVNPPRTGVRLEFRVVRRGQPVLEFKLAVLEDVLADVAKVDVEVSPVVQQRGIDGLVVHGIVVERVHHPELDVFDVRRLEVRGRQCTLDACPSVLWIQERSVCRKLRRVCIVVGTAFRGPVSQVEGREVGGKSRCGAVAVVTTLVQFLQEDLAHAVILPGFGVDLAVCLGTAVDQRRLNGVPTQARSVGVEFQVVVGGFALGKFSGLPSWGGGHEPTVHGTQVDGALGTFEIVHVGRAFVPHGAAVPWNQVSALGADVEGGLRLGVVERQGINQVGEQLALCLP